MDGDFRPPVETGTDRAAGEDRDPVARVDVRRRPGPVIDQAERPLQVESLAASALLAFRAILGLGDLAIPGKR